MRKIKFIILIMIVISAFTGCSDDKNPNTSHPQEGGINLTMDWSNVESDIPTTYNVYIAYDSGKDTLFDNLSGESNNLIVKPGKAVLYAYNETEHFYVSEGKAKIRNDGTSIPSNPGLVYSFSTEIFTEKDKDIHLNAVMKPQFKEINLNMTAKPVHYVYKIKSISTSFEGVASELNIRTNEISAPCNVQANFTRIDSQHYTSNVRLLGFVQPDPQYIYTWYEADDGRKWSTSRSEMSSLLSSLNKSGNNVLALYSSMITDKINTVFAIFPWDYNNGYLYATPTFIKFPCDASSKTVSIITDQPSFGVDLRVLLGLNDWLSFTKTDSILTISVTSNNGITTREGIIRVYSNSGIIIDIIEVTQPSVPEGFYQESEIVKLQSAAVGKGVNIVLMGDGYTLKDMEKETGKYERDMRDAVEAFFSVYPYTEYRNYFNVYMIVAISKEEGISVKTPRQFVNTTFSAIWDGEGSTYVNCSYDMVERYLFCIDELLSVNHHDLTVIMPVNANIFAGTTYMYSDENDSNDYGNGFAMCICPVGSGFKNIVVHEAGGHGFAKVADEYINYPNETIPEKSVASVKESKKYGWYENVDYYGELLQTSWKGFAGQAKYSMVGAFEGAHYYGKGIWRPELNSCMNNNIPYFNAPTRWAQVRRIYKLAGIDYSFSQFLQQDKIPEYPKNAQTKTKDFIPLPPPVIIQKTQ